MRKQNNVGCDGNNHELSLRLRDSFGEIIPKKPNRYAEDILAIFEKIPNNSVDEKDVQKSNVLPEQAPGTIESVDEKGNQKSNVLPEQTPGTIGGRSRCLAVAGISMLSVGLFVAVNAPARTVLTQTVLPVIGKALAVVAASHFFLPVIVISLACVMLATFCYYSSKKLAGNDGNNTECNDSGNQLEQN
jgi:hypothetical protein